MRLTPVLGAALLLGCGGGRDTSPRLQARGDAGGGEVVASGFEDAVGATTDAAQDAGEPAYVDMLRGGASDDDTRSGLGLDYGGNLDAITSVDGGTGYGTVGVPDKKKQRARWKPAWKATYATGDDPAVLLLEDGTVVIGDISGVRAWREGKLRWKRAASSAWLVELDGGAVLAASDDQTIAAIDPASGEARWTATIPRADGWPSRVTGGARAPDGSVWIALGGGELARVDPAACAAGTSCVALRGAHRVQDPALVFPSSGGLLLVDDASVERFDAKGKRLGAFTAPGPIVAALPVARGRVLLGLQRGELIVVDPARCRGALAGKGCVVRRVELAEPLEGLIPVDGDAIHVAGGEVTRVRGDTLATVWQEAVLAEGTPAAGPDGVMVVCAPELEAAVCTLDLATGKPRAQHRLRTSSGFGHDPAGVWPRGSRRLVRFGDAWHLHVRE